MYADKDIYLVDDAFSALDAEVGEKIFKEIFLEELEGKTRVVVTHKISLLKSFERVLNL